MAGREEKVIDGVWKKEDENQK